MTKRRDFTTLVNSQFNCILPFIIFQVLVKNIDAFHKLNLHYCFLKNFFANSGIILGKKCMINIALSAARELIALCLTCFHLLIWEQVEVWASKKMMQVNTAFHCLCWEMGHWELRLKKNIVCSRVCCLTLLGLNIIRKKNERLIIFFWFSFWHQLLQKDRRPYLKACLGIFKKSAVLTLLCQGMKTWGCKLVDGEEGLNVHTSLLKL